MKHQRRSSLIKTTKSTQDELKTILEKDPGLDDYFSIQAEAQTAGRGRQGRAWVSSPGNLHFSVLIRGPHAAVTWAPHRMALSLVRALLYFGVDRARLSVKWPNDVLVDGTQKIAGVICEKVGDHVIAGMGVNVASAPLIPERSTTSLTQVLADSTNVKVPSLDALRNQIIEELAQIPSEVNWLKREYQNWLKHRVGEAVKWFDEKSKTQISAEFVRIGEMGEMIVSEGGQERSLFSEDIHQE